MTTPTSTLADQLAAAERELDDAKTARADLLIAHSEAQSRQQRAQRDLDELLRQQALAEFGNDPSPRMTLAVLDIEGARLECRYAWTLIPGSVPVTDEEVDYLLTADAIVMNLDGDVATITEAGRRLVAGGGDE